MAETGSAKEQTYVNINDLALTEEEMQGFNPDADLYAPPPPPRAGSYQVQLFFRETDPEKRWRLGTYKDDHEFAGTNYYITDIFGKIVNPGGEFDGRRVDGGFISTGIWRDSTSAVASILKVLGYDLHGVTKQTELMQMFESAIAGEPIVGTFVDWEWKGSKEGGYIRKVGMNKFFTENPDGTFNHILEDDATGEKFPARAVITRFLPSQN